MRYVKLKGTVWQYARNYPKDVRAMVGRYKLQQSLRTSDAKVAAKRGAQVNARYEDTVKRVRAGMAELHTGYDWEQEFPVCLKDLPVTPLEFQNKIVLRLPLGPLAGAYLRHKAKELAPGGYKSVRYSVGLFTSRFADKDIRHITRGDIRAFQQDISKLSASLGKSNRWHGASLDHLLAGSQTRHDVIGVTTRKRIWTQVQSFFDWAVYEGHIQSNPFSTLRFEGKGAQASYAIPTDQEVRQLINRDHGVYGRLLVLCLLSGLRSGEGVGLLREDMIQKGNLGTFIRVRANAVRGLKTKAAERMVPLHPMAEEVLQAGPLGDRLFPNLTVNMVTKWFRKTALNMGLYRDGLVFHSTRKWFITQCERQGVPEHFTASLVGHQSARSGNGITYAIYSGGISDEQKRQIIDQLRLPL